jgi:hypothetical protein
MQIRHIDGAIASISIDVVNSLERIPGRNITICTMMIVGRIGFFHEDPELYQIVSLSGTTLFPKKKSRTTDYYLSFRFCAMFCDMQS